MNDTVVIPWNNSYLEAVRRVGGPPGPLSRIGAMMHIAMYDAINLLAGSRYESYTPKLPDPGGFPGAEAAKSAAFAARRVLATTLRDLINQAAARSGGVPSPLQAYQVNSGFNPERFTEDRVQSYRAAKEDRDPSEAFGEAVARAVLESRANDGSEHGNDDPTPPLDPSQAGEWRPTGSGAPATPGWGKVTSFGRWGPDQIARFLPTAALNVALFPDYQTLLRSPDYAGQVDEVRRLGEAHSPERTPEQTEIAFFWANDLDGTYKPPGQLFAITQAIARQEGTTDDLLQTAQLFALVGVAMADAGIVAWYVKYLWPNEKRPIRLWRPETAIREPQDDGNPDTTPDRRWQPLSPFPDGTRFSPPFPAYISGHATFGAAHGAMMRLFYGRDSIAFTATTEDPHASRDGNGVRRARRFTSFTEAARENGRSRVYLGVHYQFDAEGGFESGTKVAEYAFANVLKPKGRK